MATYTTATLVRQQVENLDASLTDSQIENYISEAEGILDAIMETSFISSFDANKHKILRAAANKYAALTALIFNPSSFTSTQEARFITDTLWEQLMFLLAVLEKETAIRYLESL